ncbi:MAG: hypothetical protein IIB54_10835 [Planctomycetes bacterium]|nr:hypothetical protein [Planctomycetota bacterium]
MASSVVGICINGTPRRYVAAANPATSPTIPPPESNDRATPLHVGGEQRSVNIAHRLQRFAGLLGLEFVDRDPESRLLQSTTYLRTMAGGNLRIDDQQCPITRGYLPDQFASPCQQPRFDKDRIGSVGQVDLDGSHSDAS